MNDFEEKYSLLVKYMLPSVHRCIDKVEFCGFLPGHETLVSDTKPKNEFEQSMNDMLSRYITPKIKIQLKKSCSNLRGIDKLGIEGDIVGKLGEIHSTFFGDQDLKLNANRRYIEIRSTKNIK